MTKGNFLVNMYPIVAKEWHPTKNGELTPYNTAPKTQKKARWICENGHEWEASVNSRTSGNGCPYCSGKKAGYGNSLGDISKELSKEWHPSKNGELTPFDVLANSSKKAWWIDKFGHEWITSVSNRTKGHGCPYCTGVKVGYQNSLGDNYPNLINEWHTIKNFDLTPFDVMPKSDKKVWWQCAEGHEWQAVVYSRSTGRGCPYCSNRKAGHGNSFGDYYPKLAKEWHQTKNQNFTPYDVTPGSQKKAWWQCKNGHEWETTIVSRKNGGGCPYCSGQMTGQGNTYGDKNPNASLEWHPTKNGDLTPYDVTPNSGRKVWWKCKNNHEWEAYISNRTKGFGKCSKCSEKSKKIDQFNFFDLL